MRSILFLISFALLLAAGYFLFLRSGKGEDNLAGKISRSENFIKWNRFLNLEGREIRLRADDVKKRQRFTRLDLDKITDPRDMILKRTKTSSVPRVPVKPTTTKNFDSAFVYIRKLSIEFPELRKMAGDEKRRTMLAAYKLYDKQRKATYANYFDN